MYFVFLNVFSICRIPPLAVFISFFNPSTFHRRTGGKRNGLLVPPTIPSIFGPLFENSCFRPTGISQSLPAFSIPGPPRLSPRSWFLVTLLTISSHRSRQISFHPPHLLGLLAYLPPLKLCFLCSATSLAPFFSLFTWSSPPSERSFLQLAGDIPNTKARGLKAYFASCLLWTPFIYYSWSSPSRGGDS